MSLNQSLQPAQVAGHKFGIKSKGDDYQSGVYKYNFISKQWTLWIPLNKFKLKLESLGACFNAQTNKLFVSVNCELIIIETENKQIDLKKKYIAASYFNHPYLININGIIHVIVENLHLVWDDEQCDARLMKDFPDLSVRAMSDRKTYSFEYSF